MEEIEKSFTCPYCLQHISMLLDLSLDGEHSYIEDCEVCCRPIQLTYTVEVHQLLRFDYQAT
jgi:hypothetical protein